MYLIQTGCTLCNFLFFKWIYIKTLALTYLTLLITNYVFTCIPLCERLVIPARTQWVITCLALEKALHSHCQFIRSFKLCRLWYTILNSFKEHNRFWFSTVVCKLETARCTTVGGAKVVCSLMARLSAQNWRRNRKGVLCEPKRNCMSSEHPISPFWSLEDWCALAGPSRSSQRCLSSTHGVGRSCGGECEELLGETQGGYYHQATPRGSGPIDSDGSAAPLSPE